MNKKHTLSFLFEYIVVIFIFALVSSVCLYISVSSYKTNELNARKRLAIEYGSNLIESNSLSFTSYHLNDELKEDENGKYYIEINEVTDEFKHKQLVIYYDGQELVSLEFYQEASYE